MLAPSMKVQKNLRYGQLFWEKLNYVFSHSIFMKFKCEPTKGIPNFILIGHKTAEIHSKEVNRALSRKMDIVLL